MKTLNPSRGRRISAPAPRRSADPGEAEIWHSELFSEAVRRREARLGADAPREEVSRGGCGQCGGSRAQVATRMSQRIEERFVRDPEGELESRRSQVVSETPRL